MQEIRAKKRSSPRVPDRLKSSLAEGRARPVRNGEGSHWGFVQRKALIGDVQTVLFLASELWSEDGDRRIKTRSIGVARGRRVLPLAA